jgi:hypothetical protein
MLTIIGIGIAAIAAVRTYNRKREADPTGTDVAVTHIRQSTSVVLAVGNAIWAVLDALMFLTRTFGGGSNTNGGGGSGQKAVFGSKLASDVGE